jgi:hypothetical protein
VVEVLQEVERRGDREEEIGELKDAFRPVAAASQHCGPLPFMRVKILLSQCAEMHGAVPL